jgi:hypothetical protein
MRKITLTVCLFISVLLLTACSSQISSPTAQLKPAEGQKKVLPMRVVSSAKPADVLPAFTTFSWNEKYNRVLAAVDSDNENMLKTYIRSELITYLATKGYQYQSNPARADVVIGFLFASQDALADKNIQERFGLVPARNKSLVTAPHYKKGTLLLSVLDRDLKTVYWRSAVQGFVDLEKDKSTGSDHRLRQVLALVMAGFPKAGR